MNTQSRILTACGLGSTVLIPFCLLLPQTAGRLGVIALSVCAFLFGSAGYAVASLQNRKAAAGRDERAEASPDQGSLPGLGIAGDRRSDAQCVRIGVSPDKKEDFDAADLLAEFNETKTSEEKLSVSCFDPSLLAVYRAALPDLVSSIVTYMNGTSEPMSEKLVRIKTSIADFLAKVKTSQNSYEARNGASKIKDGIHLLRTHITEVTQETSRSFGEVSGEISALDAQMSSILDIVASISDVAERIHVLSINASIEAARAGVHGRGFKVIADEVQRLSRETQTFVTTIGNSVSGTQGAFASLHATMERNRKEVDRFVLDDNSTYKQITDTLDSQIADVMELYQAVLGFIGSLEMDMTAFAPLGMLHAIIAQEVENLALVGRDLIDLIAASSGSDSRPGAACEARPEDAGVRKGIESIRKRLTTSRELDALEAAVKKAGWSGQANLKRTNTEIEFF